MAIRRAAVAALLLIATLPYAGALSQGFVYDDDAQVVRNDLVRSLDPRPVLAGGAVTRGRVEWYRPLTIYSFAVEYWADGLHPRVFHLTNVALHASNSLLVLRIGELLLGSWSGGWAAAVLFAAQAVHTEAIVPVFGRADLLAAFFVLAGWFVALRTAGPPAVLGAAACFAAALLSKESAVGFLPAVVVGDLISARLRGADWGTVRALMQRRRALYGALASALLLYLALRVTAIGGVAAAGSSVRYIENPLVEAHWLERIATASWVALRSLWLCVVPWPLSADYSYNQIPLLNGFADARLLLLIAAAGVVAVLALRRPASGLTLGLLLFACLLLPVSNLLVPIGTIMAERLIYLPSMAICLIAGAGLAASVRVRTGWPRIPVPIGLSVFVAANAWASVVRTHDWRSDEAVFESAVRISPRSAKARFNLASVLLDRGDTAGAERLLDSAVAIAPVYPEACNLLGTIYLARDELPAAERAFRAAVRDAPDYAPALGNLGIVLRREGRLSEAEPFLRRAVERDPSLTAVYLNLALIAEHSGERAAAIALYRRAFALDSRLTAIRNRADALAAGAALR